MKTIAKISVVLVLSVLCSFGLADELYVPGQYPTIQAAINAAVTGDTVLVADGTYTGPGNRDINFLGKAITVRSQSGPENCIIDCNAGRWDQHRGFSFTNNEDGNSVLEGFTITNGHAEFSGAAIHCQNSSPIITSCIIKGNVSYDGGAVVCYWSSAVVTNCTIVENTDKGIVCFGGTIITNCIINKNTNNGIWCYEDTTIGNCTISENEDDGISCADTTVSSCTVTGNRAAGIWCKGNVTIKNCVISENNRGGVVFYGSNSKIIDSLITRNRSWSGAGIRCGYKRRITVANCTISDNTAQEKGGAIFCEGSTLLVSDCILWGDTAPIGSEICIIGNWYWPSSVSAWYNNVQGGEKDVYVGSYSTLNWGEGNIDADPCFVLPGYWADANDPNIIVEPNDPNAVWIEGDYHLLPASPCIDTGDPNYIPSPNETDLDGNPRVIGDAVDMGAYESNYIKVEMNFIPKTVNCNSKGNWVKAHITLPDEFLPEDVDVNTPAWAEPIDLESEYIKVLGSHKGPVKLEIAFDRQAFCDAITEPGQLEVTIIGSLTTGQNFYATDSIKIIPQR